MSDMTWLHNCREQKKKNKNNKQKKNNNGGGGSFKIWGLKHGGASVAATKWHKRLITRGHGPKAFAFDLKRYFNPAPGENHFK